jgi:hypothetical protein
VKLCLHCFIPVYDAVYSVHGCQLFTATCYPQLLNLAAAAAASGPEDGSSMSVRNVAKPTLDSTSSQYRILELKLVVTSSNPVHSINPIKSSDQYMYRTVVTICTAQWSLYVPHSCHYMYRTVATTCTAQWSLYVPHSCQYMYRTVVTICTAQWSLYVPPV